MGIDTTAAVSRGGNAACMALAAVSALGPEGVARAFDLAYPGVLEAASPQVAVLASDLLILAGFAVARLGELRQLSAEEVIEDLLAITRENRSR